MKWAKYNLGAKVPESTGLYFSWGNTDGHPAGAGYDFSQAVYDTTPAAAIAANLSLSQDAARAYLGAPWRMPTDTEFQELYENCTHVWTSLNGVNGLLFTSNVNGKTLFFPAAGFCGGTSIYNRGSNGIYWSSTYDSVSKAYVLGFESLSVSLHYRNERRFGVSVRAVQEGTPNRSIIPPIPEDETKDEPTPREEEPKDDNQR